jgi:hypothetical protein
VFSAGHQIYVYFQAYKQSAGARATQAAGQKSESPQPLFAFVSLYQGGKRMFETEPKSILPNTANELGMMSLNFGLGVDNLPRGVYDCQVTVLDPSTQKAVFWRAPIKLVQ